MQVRREAKALRAAEASGRKTEEALREAVEYARGIVETIREPLVVLDSHLRVVSANRSFYRSFKVSRNETEGQYLYDLGNRQWDIPTLRVLLEEMLPKKTSIEHFEVRHNFPSIGERIMLLNARELRRKTGRNPLILLAIEDITERKLAEEALRRAHNELDIRVRERTAELAKTNEQLIHEIEERRRAEEALRESAEKMKLFAYSIVHDLRNPAVGIHGLTKLLLKHYREALNDKGKQYCDQILRATEQLAALVERINLYITARETPLFVETVNLKDLVKMVHEDFSSRLSARKIRWLEPEELPEIRADSLSLLRVLRNFVDNALKYGGEELSKIEIGYEETDTHHVLSVADDGVGLNREQCESIFKPFVRERTTARGIEGSGLGLAIAKEIAEQHGGEVWVELGTERSVRFFVSVAKLVQPVDGRAVKVLQ
jgi:PAS domain S-box-containing protein